MTHIFIATPMYGGQCTGFFTQSCVQLPTMARDKNMSVSFSFLFNESLIQRGRNLLAHQFLKREDATHLMFIDADIRFNPHDIFSMIEADQDIICGLYPKKEINWHNVHAAATKGNVPYDQLTHYTGAMVVNLIGDNKGMVTVPVDKPCEIAAGGTGFMLIKRKVMERLAKKVKTYTNDVSTADGKLARDEIHEFFPVFIDPEEKRLLSEDYAFCKIARKAGFKIHGAPWVRLGHFGSYLFEGGPVPAP